MKNTEVIKEVSQKTGIETEKCEKVLKAFEEQAGDTLTNKFKGIKDSKEDILAKISDKSGVAAEECKKIVDTLDETLNNALSNKLRFIKK